MPTDSSPSERLTPLQRRVLRAWFEREAGFWLTGGAALAGFHLHHRSTGDLDLFTSDDRAFERGPPVLRDVAHSLQLRLEGVQDAPGFKRFVLSAAEDAVVVDLVLERAVQAFPEKDLLDGIRVDPVEEILANKLAALVGRMEERDLVDVLLLERAGLRVEDSLAAALAKDGGCTPATLAWLLSEIVVSDGVPLPAMIEASDLRTWLDDLVRRLRVLSFPAG